MPSATFAACTRRRIAAEPPADAPRAFTSARISTRYRTPAHSTVCSASCMAIALVELLDEKTIVRSPSRSSDFPTRKACDSARPFLGSRALAGHVRCGAARSHRRRRAARCATPSRQFGLEPNRIPDAQAPPNALGYLEFHIEQGPVLENLNLPLAVVDVISGQSRAELTFAGMAGHAGTTPMKMRKDALACAAAWITEVEREALTTSGLVATVGRIAVEPGAGNVVPGRSGGVARRPPSRRWHAESRGRALVEGGGGDRRAPRTEDDVGAAPRSAVGRDGSRRSRRCSIAQSSNPARRRIACRAVPGTTRWCSRRRCRAGMLFLRCEGGISHHPAENVREDDVAAALEAGLKFLDELELAQRD